MGRLVAFHRHRHPPWSPADSILAMDGGTGLNAELLRKTAAAAAAAATAESSNPLLRAARGGGIRGTLARKPVVSITIEKGNLYQNQNQGHHEVPTNC